MKPVIIQGVASLKYSAQITSNLVFNKTNTNGTSYAVFTAKREDGATISGTIYENMAEKLGCANGSEIEVAISCEDILAGHNNHYSPVFSTVSDVTKADMDAAKAFLDSL